MVEIACSRISERPPENNYTNSRREDGEIDIQFIKTASSPNKENFDILSLGTLIMPKHMVS